MWIRDIQHVLRQLRRSPAFSATVAGGVLGLLVAHWTLPGVLALTPNHFEDIAPHTDVGTTAFTLLLSVGAGLLVGIAPVLHAFSVRRKTLKRRPKSGRLFAIPSPSPVGHRFRISSGGPWLNVVGVVVDVKHASLREEIAPEFYVSYAQLPWSFMTVVVRSDHPLPAVVRDMAVAISSVDPLLPVPSVRPMRDLIADSMGTEDSRQSDCPCSPEWGCCCRPSVSTAFCRTR